MNRSMDDTQTTGPTTEEMAAAQTPAGEDPPNGPAETHSDQPGFGERGRMRRRMRFLRKARELAYRDLGGLVFDLHRFGRRNDALVLAKLETVGRIDTELRALEATLAERRPVTVLREAGVAACPRCAAIHGSNDRFCPNCGLAMDLRAERPIAASTPAPTYAPAAAPAPTPEPPPAPAPQRTPAPKQAPATSPAPAPQRTPVSQPTPAPERTPATSPAPASPPAPAPAQPPVTTRPAGPAPTVDQPTEIVRPPSQDP
jgi:hypothetical protein